MHPLYFIVFHCIVTMKKGSRFILLSLYYNYYHSKLFGQTVQLKWKQCPFFISFHNNCWLFYYINLLFNSTKTIQQSNEHCTCIYFNKKFYFKILKELHSALYITASSKLHCPGPCKGIKNCLIHLRSLVKI